MLLADDMVVFGTCPIEVQKVLDIIGECSEDIVAPMNAEKSAAMYFGPNQEEIKQKTEFTLNAKKLVWKKEI